LQLLTVEAEGKFFGDGIEFLGDELELDQQPGGTAGVVIGVLAGAGLKNFRHEETDLGGREKFAGTLARALGEFAQKVFVAAAEEVGLDVFKAEAVAGIGEDLDDAA